MSDLNTGIYRDDDPPEQMEVTESNSEFSPDLNPSVEGLGTHAVHAVETGEHLESLAVKYYGNADMWPTLYNANRDIIGSYKENPTREIVPGWELIIPSLDRSKVITDTPALAVHVVGKCETLMELAEKYYGRAADWSEIYNANKGAIGDDPNRISVGQALVIPDIEIPAKSQTLGTTVGPTSPTTSNAELRMQGELAETHPTARVEGVESPQPGMVDDVDMEYTTPAVEGLGFHAIHTVEAGERLESLAVKHYGNADMWPTIYNANKEIIGSYKENPTREIVPGWELSIPSLDRDNAITDTPALAVHVVGKGETLMGLAEKYYGRAAYWSDIYNANKVAIGDDPNKISVGQALVIPDLETLRKDQELGKTVSPSAPTVL